MTSEEENIDICNGLLDAINTRNYSILNKIMDRDFKDHHPGIGEKVSNLNSYKEALESIHKSLNMKASVDFKIAKDDKVITHVTLSGKHIGKFMGIEPTQKEVVWKTIEIYRIENGRIVERWALDDLFGLLSQLGSNYRNSNMGEGGRFILTYMFQIVIKKGCETEAIKTLSKIESSAQHDRGCINFIWLQNKENPQRFTLFEQWENEEMLEEHKNKSPEIWANFVHCLAEEPTSEQFYTVKSL